MDTIQTAFKFDVELNMLPKVSFDSLHDKDVESLVGILKNPDIKAIESDPRAKAIWER